MSAYWCELAWLGGERAEAGVLVEVGDDRIAAVTTNLPEPPPGAEPLAGMTLPGLANAHSHAFQRALRGRTQGGAGSFWTWREQMYALADQLDPDRYLALARATFGEMALAGVTTVGEFHYLHHGPGGVPYADPNVMGRAVITAAGEVGIRLTLIDACYLEGGIATPPEGAQQRFCDASGEAWAARVEALADSTTVRIAAAIHSIRAVPPAAAKVVAGWTAGKACPLHAHVSEQPAENEACLAAYGGTPVQVLADAGAVSSQFTAVHATHLEEADFLRLGEGKAFACLCPTTERDLADGIAPARRLRDAGARLSLGSDSNAFIDLFEEARAVELDERMLTNQRGGHRPIELLRAATSEGAECLGWPSGGRIETGALADLVVVGLDSQRLAGAATEDALAAVVFAASAADVRHVMAAGRWIVRDGAHATLDVRRELTAAIAALVPA
ncbi:MAG: formimidoylglutamate deiminase [Candidatus Dormibacteraeota bacterium]|nr:formimidoylglutamate deiminase [Candidatus Dormibacteraeota bacterium]